MTTQSVTELSSFFSVSASGRLAQGVTGNMTTQMNSGFSQMMDRAGAQSGNGNDLKSTSDKDSSYGRSAEIVNESGRLGDTKGKVTDTSSADKDLDRDSLQDSVKEVTDKIVEDLKKQLDVTDEDIEDALEVLGLALVDLLNASSLREVYIELSPADSSLALVTDAQLYQGLTQMLDEVDELLSQLQDELGIGKEEFENLVASLLDEGSDEGVLQGQEVLTADALEESDDPEPISGPEIIVNDEREQEVTDTFAKVDEADGKSSVSGHRSEKGEARDSSLGEQSLTSYTQQTIEFDDLMAPTQGLGYSSGSEAVDITRQIVSQIRVNISQETTQMEMELNPASLGRVGLTIEAKNGVITAQFAAQNEAVKAAIESQVAMLRESLDEQGVKVEAVEVTIASHEFEQNLDKQSDDERRQDEASAAQAVSGRRRMRINLLDDDDEEEELSEEESINKDMMIRNGNTVDYTA